MNKELENIAPSKAGRPKGSPNARTQDLFEIAERLDCNPFEILLMFAKCDYSGLGMLEYKTIITKSGQEIQEPSISPELQQRAAKDACEYLFPKRKAIEHSGEINGADMVRNLIKEVSGIK